MDISAIALGGLNQAQGNFEKAARRIASGGAASGDATDLASDTVSLISARNDFAANIKTLKVADEMQRTTLDLLG